MSAEINLTPYITFVIGFIAGIGPVKIARWLKRRRDRKDATKARTWRDHDDGDYDIR